MKEAKLAVNNSISFLTLLLILFFCWLLGRYFCIDTDRIRNFLLKFPLIYSAIAFVLLYVVITFFIWFSKDIFRVAGAVIFGAYLSTLLVYLAEMINAAALFNLSRFLGRGFVKSHLKGSFVDLDDRIYNVGFWGMFAIRIVPLVPFRFLDIAAGLTRVSFSEYFLISAIASPLRIFWLQFVLAAVGSSVFKDADLLTKYFLNNQNVFIFSLFYLIASIIVGIFLKRSVFKKGGKIG